MAEATSTANPPKKLGRWSTFFFFFYRWFTLNIPNFQCAYHYVVYTMVKYIIMAWKVNQNFFFFFAGCIVKLFSQDTREDLETSMKILHCWRLMVLTQNQKLHTTMANDVHMYTKLRGTLVNTVILCNLWQKSFVFLRW